jgi:N-dimethylarginine dimethylaminohydrolase
MNANPGFGGQSMVAPLHRVLVCSPLTAGWDRRGQAGGWRELGYLHPPDVAAAERQHEALRRALQDAGVDVVALEQDDALSLDAVYVHDPSFITDHGATLLRMGKACRGTEPKHHGAFYQQQGIPLLGEIRPPGEIEGGDMVWLDDSTLMIGRGYRTNASGIDQVRALLGPMGVEVLSAPLPHGGGPDTCLHLMSLLSLLDERTALVDLPWLAVETLELLRDRGFRLIEIEPAERALLACNVLALGSGRLLAFAESPKTNQRLRDHGFEVITVPGSEMGINGGGGPTCLTRPLLRG